MVRGVPRMCTSTTGTSPLGRQRPHARVRQRGHVVDQVRARVERALGDGRLLRVDRDGDIGYRAQARNDRQHALALVVRGHGIRSRPGGFAADVDDGRATGGHRLCLPVRLPGGSMPACRKERIGRAIDHAHHRLAAEIQNAGALLRPVAATPEYLHGTGPDRRPRPTPHRQVQPDGDGRAPDVGSSPHSRPDSRRTGC